MRVMIRADASVTLGSGHVMRCLTLAEELTEKGAVISFISRDLPGNLNEYVEYKGFPVHRLPSCEEQMNWESDAHQVAGIIAFGDSGLDWLIVDHYGLDERWERYLRRHTRRIMVIDDLADRPHDCDLLLDQNLYQNMEIRYQGLVPKNCRLLLGPPYALLRKEFYEIRKNLRKRDGDLRRMLIFFGGSDPTNETGKALQAVKLLNRPEIAVDVVVGSANPQWEVIRDLCASIPNTRFYYQVENMAEMMNHADLAIGAGGTAMWERCCLGLPALVVVVATNQLEPVLAAENRGMIINLGWQSGINPEKMAVILEKTISASAELSRISRNALAIWDDCPTNSSLNAILEYGSGK